MVTVSSCPEMLLLLSVVSLDEGKGKYHESLPFYFPQEGIIISQKAKEPGIAKAESLILLLRCKSVLGPTCFACWRVCSMLCAVIIHPFTNSFHLAWFPSGILIQFIWKPVWEKCTQIRGAPRATFGLGGGCGTLTEAWWGKPVSRELPERRKQPHSLAFFGGASCWHRILYFVSTLRAEQSPLACLSTNQASGDWCVNQNACLLI